MATSVILESPRPIGQPRLDARKELKILVSYSREDSFGATLGSRAMKTEDFKKYEELRSEMRSLPAKLRGLLGNESAANSFCPGASTASILPP
jgi:hypothetical protein